MQTNRGRAISAQGGVIGHQVAIANVYDACGFCGQRIIPGQLIARRMNSTWVHDACHGRPDPRSILWSTGLFSCAAHVIRPTGFSTQCGLATVTAAPSDGGPWRIEPGWLWACSAAMEHLRPCKKCSPWTGEVAA